MTSLTREQSNAADWLETHWLEQVANGPLTRLLRERFALPFIPACQVIAEVKRRRDGK